MRVADFGLHRKRPAERAARNEPQPVREQRVAEDRRLVRQGDGVVLRIKAAHITVGPEGNPKPLALPDRIVQHPPVPSDHVARVVEVIPLLGGLSGVPGDEGDIVAVRHEADVLAVRFGLHRQSRFCGQRAHLALVVMVERQQQHRKQALVQVVEHVGLVLAGLGAAPQLIAARRLVEPHRRVVPRRDAAVPEAPGVPRERAELDAPVAGDAGVGRLAAQVAVREAVEHPLGKEGAVIEDVMRDAELFADRLRIGDVLLGAAVEELERCAAHLIAPLLQEQRRHRAVHAAAHGDQHLFHFYAPPFNATGEASLRAAPPVYRTYESVLSVCPPGAPLRISRSFHMWHVYIIHAVLPMRKGVFKCLQTVNPRKHR